MKLYVANRLYPYEGFDILGIFSTKEAAQKVCDDDEYGDGYLVEELELDVPHDPDLIYKMSKVGKI